MHEEYTADHHPSSPDTWSIIRERLKAGDYVVGLTVTSNNVETGAYAATLGFHFLWSEMEHSPLSLESLRTLVLATRGLPVPVFARVPWAELWLAKRVLDQGVQGVIFPFVSTLERARIAVQGCHYPPFGRRGSGAGLAVTTWPAFGNYYDSADANVLVICVIEEAAGVEQIEEIAALETSFAKEREVQAADGSAEISGAWTREGQRPALSKPGGQYVGGEEVTRQRPITHRLR